MKINEKYSLREMGNLHLLVYRGGENADLSSGIKLNESAALLWGEASRLKEFDVESLADFLVQNYEIDKKTALQDCERLVETWQKNGLAFK